MRQSGFSLIELLIAIAIIGILAALTIPAAQNNIIKARVTEGFQLVESAKLAIAETVMMTNALPASSKEAGYVDAEPTKNVESITIGKQAVITMHFTPLAGDGTLLLIPDLHPTGELTWNCSGGTLNMRYRPASCR